MSKRRLQSRLQGIQRNKGPVITAGPVSFTTTQCCTHRPRVKCVQANACPCRAAICPCKSGCPSENCHKRGPTRDPTAPRLTTNVSENSRRPDKPPQPSFMTFPRLSSTKTHWRSHLASSLEDTSGMPYRCAPTPPMRPHRSLRQAPLTLLHRRPLGAAK